MTRESIFDEDGELVASFCPTDTPLSDKGREALAAVVKAVREDMANSPPRDRPSPFQLWQQAKGDREAYRHLLREHGHLIDRKPGDDPNLPCGWPGNRIEPLATGGVVTGHAPIGQHGCVIEPAHSAPTFSCIKCGPITAAEIYLLNWESPHGDERCQRCGGGDLEIPRPAETPEATDE